MMTRMFGFLPPAGWTASSGEIAGGALAWASDGSDEPRWGAPLAWRLTSSWQDPAIQPSRTPTASAAVVERLIRVPMTLPPRTGKDPERGEDPTGVQPLRNGSAGTSNARGRTPGNVRPAFYLRERSATSGRGTSGAGRAGTRAASTPPVCWPRRRVFPCVPASLATVGLVEVMPSWTDLYHSAWSLGFGTSLLVYSGLTLRRPGGAALPRGS